MKITLRVVGIQFKEDVYVDVDKPRIEDVMKAAEAQIPGFKYQKAPDGTLHSVSAHIAAKPSISSGRNYAAGLYSLADGVVGENHISTWQWYLVRDGEQLNTPNGKIERFSDESEFELKDEDTIIWRLVIVLAGPTIPCDVSAFQCKASKLA